jgi:flagella basal body P-ring formation protein FlgA
MIWWTVFAMNLLTAACTPIQSDRLTVSDLARALPEFRSATPDAQLGYAPLPGSRRVFRIDEVRRLASRFDVRLTPEREACFEWRLERLRSENIVQAMRESLALPEAQIDVLELSHAISPPGRIVFPMSGLLADADRHTGGALWRGYVLYSDKKRFDIWAKVRISAPTTRVVSRVAITPGHTISAEEVRLDVVNDFPIWRDVARNLDEVVGRVAQRGIAAGRAIIRTELTEAPAVQAGQVVEVIVIAGHARIKAAGVAENTARTGDMIRVRNPRSGKFFRARVEANGKVVVLPGVAGGEMN